MRQSIKGAILIYSCHKHKDTRLKEFKLPNDEYAGWKVFYILGNPQIKKDFLLGNTILLKCEDSYIHVAKKVVMGIKFIYENYEIEQGVLRCGDDLVFNETTLVNFLKMEGKPDYMGITANANMPNTVVPQNNNFMPAYYASHPEDLQNPLHGIPYTMREMMQFNKVPKLKYAGGVVVYLSNKSCNTLVAHFENIGWNVFASDETYGYPYIIEDIAVGYILHMNNIFLTHFPLYIDRMDDFKKYNGLPIALHTNKYK
jgi:hypothetical protein